MNRLKQSLVRRAMIVCGCLLLTWPGLMTGEDLTTIPTSIDLAADPLVGSEVASQDLDIVVQDGKVNLSLEQVTGLALRRNLTLVVQRYQRGQSILSINEALGIYDINLSANGGISEDTSPTTSALQATAGGALTSEFQRVNIQGTRLTPFGGTAQVDFNNSRSVTSNLNDTLNPSFSLGLDLTFSQPLLRNFGRYVTERNLIVARTNAAISREDFQAQVETVIQQVSDSYWNLVESIQQLDVAQKSLDLAKELHRMNKIQVEVGTVAPLEVVTSEARVAARQQDIIRLRAQVEDNADLLRRLANLDRGQLWNVEIVPTTDPEVEHQVIDLEEAVKTALDNRTDIRRRRLQNETLALNARVARNQKLPNLSVSATYGTNAVEGDAFSFIDPDTGMQVSPPVLVGSTDYFDAVDTIVGAEFDGWSLGFNFAVPLQNRAAKARSVTADLAQKQGDYQLQDLELQILSEVRSATRGVRTAAEQIESAKISSKLQDRNLQAEQKRYENGLSTSFRILEFQEDLSEAQRAEVSAIISYRRAEVAFYRAIGELLGHFDVKLADDESN